MDKLTIKAATFAAILAATLTGCSTPAARVTSPAIPPSAAATATAPMVWVNTATGVFHRPWSRWYGKTDAGRMMPLTDALAAHFRPARNGQ